MTKRSVALGRVFLLALLARPVHAASWTPTVEVGATWNDNITNANRSSDQIDALSTNVDAAATTRIGFARNDSLGFAGHVASEWTPRFDDLRQHALGGRAEWQHKFGLGPLASTLGVQLAIDAVLAGDRDRAGTPPHPRDDKLPGHAGKKSRSDI